MKARYPISALMHVYDYNILLAHSTSTFFGDKAIRDYNQVFLESDTEDVHPHIISVTLPRTSLDILLVQETIGASNCY